VGGSLFVQQNGAGRRRGISKKAHVYGESQKEDSFNKKIKPRGGKGRCLPAERFVRTEGNSRRRDDPCPLHPRKKRPAQKVKRKTEPGEEEPPRFNELEARARRNQLSRF